MCKFCAWCVCTVCVCGVWCECNKMHAVKMNRSPYQFTYGPPSLLESVGYKFPQKVTLSVAKFLDYLRLWPQNSGFSLKNGYLQKAIGPLPAHKFPKHTC